VVEYNEVRFTSVLHFAGWKVPKADMQMHVGLAQVFVSALRAA
jgi:hypothetical protein